MVHRLVLGMIWMLFTVDFFYSCKTKRVGGSNATQWTQIYWTVQHWWFICSLIFFTWILQVLRSKGMLPSSIPAFHKLLLFSKSKNVQSIKDKLYPALNTYICRWCDYWRPMSVFQSQHTSSNFILTASEGHKKVITRVFDRT